MPIWRSRVTEISDITINQDIPMAGYKLTGLGAAAANQNSVRVNAALRVPDSVKVGGKTPAAASGIATLDASTKVPHAQLDEGVTEGKIVVMAAGDKLPAVDGSNLTNIPPAYRGALVYDMQKIAATGDMTNPERVNDNNTGVAASGAAQDLYCEIAFEETLYISQYRIWSFHGSSNGSGRFKLQYRNVSTGVWTDWKTGIPVTSTNDWAAWDTGPSRVLTDGLRIIITTVDTGSATNSIQQLEVKD